MTSFTRKRFKRKPIKQHKDMLVDSSKRVRVHKDKKVFLREQQDLEAKREIEELE